MKHTKKYIALCLAMALGCLAVLTACSSDKSTSQTQSTVTSSSQASSGSTESTEAQETVMGEVTYVGSSYISVTAYTCGEDVTDFTTLDVSGLTASEDTESIDTTEDTEYLKVESGMLNAATRDDVTTGSFIVSTYDEDGTHQIILVESGDAEYLIIGGKMIGRNRFYIESASESWDRIYSRGELAAASVTLNLGEYS